MRLEAGSKLGHYEILSSLGAGGMGEVYRARDTKLGREVALKVLPEAFTSDPERLARFEHEAKVLASLNHPQIAAIYGLEEADGFSALILELVGGPTLADRIAQGPIAPAEAVLIARQIAEALEAAHERGIIHRDLKPANVKVRPDGTVKLLDFGLAKALQPETAPDDSDLSQSPTVTAAGTRIGVILGTAAYMAPEQARGKTVDRRADLWAFGCVLYEMLTGSRPFGGGDIAETLARVIEREPDWTELAPIAGPRLVELLKGCLEKDPRSRWHHAADVRLLLEKSSFDAGAVATTGSGARGARAVLAWCAIAFALGATLTHVVTRSASPRDTPLPQPIRFAVDLDTDSGQVMSTVSGTLPAISPDGRTVAYVGPREEDSAGTSPGDGQLYLRRLGELRPRIVSGTAGAQTPFFSPGGDWVGFLAQGKLQRAPTEGGAPLTICDLSIEVHGASWGPDDTIVFGGGIGSGLMRVPAAGGTPVPLTWPDLSKAEVHHGFPDVLPDGRTALFTIGTGTGSRLARLSLDKNGEWEEILSYGANPSYVSGGYLVFSDEGALPADAVRLAEGCPGRSGGARPRRHPMGERGRSGRGPVRCLAHRRSRVRSRRCRSPRHAAGVGRQDRR